MSAHTLASDNIRVLLDYVNIEDFESAPVVIGHADESTYHTLDGRTFYDGLSGIFVNSLGHGRTEIVSALKAQADLVTFAPPMHATTAPSIELAQKLCDIAPGDAGAVKFFSAGTEAIEAAIKLSRQIHLINGQAKRSKVVSLYGSYHGGTLGAMAASGFSALKSDFEYAANGFVHVLPPSSDGDRSGHDDPGRGLACAQTLIATIDAEGADTVSCVLVCPMYVTKAGIYEPDQAFFDYVSEGCRQRGVLLVVDEIITGFGRLGDMFASSHVGLTPDILVVGKGMGGGYVPLSAMIVSSRLSAALRSERNPGRTFNSGSTFGGNPLATAVGLAVLNYIESHDVVAHVREEGKALHLMLGEIASRYPFISGLLGRGLLQGVAVPKDPDIAADLGAACFDRGLLLRSAPGYIALCPPLTTHRTDLVAMVSIMDDALASV